MTLLFPPGPKSTFTLFHKQHDYLMHPMKDEKRMDELGLHTYVHGRMREVRQR